MCTYVPGVYVDYVCTCVSCGVGVLGRAGPAGRIARDRLIPSTCKYFRPTDRYRYLSSL